MKTESIIIDGDIKRHRTSRRFIFLTGIAGILPMLMGPDCDELEPNNDLATANLLRMGEYGRGAVSPVADVDVWQTQSLTEFDLIYAYVDPQGSTTSLDTFLEVFAPDGATLVRSDDDSGPPPVTLSSVVAGESIPAGQAGPVFFRVTESGNDATISESRLYHAVVNRSNGVIETEPNNSALTADMLTGDLMSGAVGMGSGDLDFYRFTVLTGNARVVVIMDDNPTDAGAFTDTDLHIVDQDGTTFLAVGDNSGGNHANAAGSVTVAAPGVYFIRVGNGGATSGAFYEFVLLVNGVLYRDSDGDGFPDTDDNCPALLNPVQQDTDADGVGDGCDTCFSDLAKQVPGVCGCGQPDVDVNGDGIIDCGLADPARALLAGVGLMLVPDVDNNRVMAFDPFDGDLVDPNFIPTDNVNLATPIAAILGPDRSSILVSDQGMNLVQRYDLDGNYLGVFAPAGGVNPVVLQQPGGITYRPNGNLLVCVQAGANADAVAEFNPAGNYVGNFIANGAGGLSTPTDIVVLANGNALVASAGSSRILEYDAAGTFVGDFAVVDSNVSQVSQTLGGRFIVGGGEFSMRGILEFDATGVLANRRSPARLNGFVGVAELIGGGRLFTATTRIVTGGADGRVVGGAFVNTGSGGDFTARFVGASLRDVEFAKIDTDGDGVGDAVDGCPNDANKTVPGQCGCGNADSDSDGDGTADCTDGCPADALKVAVGACGCGVSDTDANGNGVPDCLDVPLPPPFVAPGCCAPGTSSPLGVLLLYSLMGHRGRKRRKRG